MFRFAMETGQRVQMPPGHVLGHYRKSEKPSARRGAAWRASSFCWQDGGRRFGATFPSLQLKLFFPSHFFREPHAPAACRGGAAGPCVASEVGTCKGRLRPVAAAAPGARLPVLRPQVLVNARRQCYQTLRHAAR